jgi:putative two-component system response regulator
VTSLASNELQALAASGRSAADPDVGAVLERVAAEIAGRMQNASPLSADFFRSVSKSVAKLQGGANAEIRIQCLLDTAQYFYVLGRPFEAIGPASEALSLASDSGNKSLTRKACTFLGAMHADTGNISGAIECYSRALELLRDLNDPVAECRVWINSGVALMYAAQYAEAIACCEHAIDLAGQSPDLYPFRANAFANIALCCLHMEDFSRGLRAAETSITESLEPSNAADMLSRVIRECNYSRLLLEVNNVGKAIERCEVAKHYASLSKSARAELLSSTIEGLCEVHAGKVDVGISRLTATLEKARLSRPALRETLTALVKAFELIGQPDRALIYLREMIEANRVAQQENSLQHLKLHLDKFGREPQGGNAASVQLQRREAALKGKIAEQELFQARIEMLERLAVTAELRDDSTGEHSYRVGKLASLLALEYGCDEDTCFMIELAARLHDVGKIGVPDAILLKPDKLNPAEQEIMRTHSTVGAELLSKSNIPHMQMAEEIARHHHEWWNGTGYPACLSGTAIPLAARITALADVYDALTHKRPYKVAWSVEDALEEIAKLKGRQFEPELTDRFMVLIPKIRRQHGDLDVYLGQAALKSPFLQARSRIWQALHRGADNGATASGSRLDLQR